MVVEPGRLPPIAWLVILLARQRSSIVRLLPRFRSVPSRCLAAIKRAEDGQSIAAALTAYIAERSNKVCKTSTEAVGALRGAGMYDIASEVETFLLETQRTSVEQAPGSLLQPMLTSNASADLAPRRDKAIALTEQLEVKFAERRKIRLQPVRTGERTAATGGLARRSLGLVLAAALLASSANSALAADPIVLSSTQQQAILAEAVRQHTPRQPKSRRPIPPVQWICFKLPRTSISCWLTAGFAMADCTRTLATRICKAANLVARS